MGIVFGDGREPWSVARGGVKRWLHCRAHVDALPGQQRDELTGWLADHGISEVPQVVLITRGADDSLQVHVPDGPVDVELAGLPAWLQRPEPQAVRRPVRRRRT